MKCECGVCKRCGNREAVKRYRERHPDRRKESCKKQNIKKKKSGYFQKKYQENPSYREKTLARNKKRAKENPEAVKLEVKRHQEKNREKYLARQCLRRAVNRGKIIKPVNCERCGMKKERIEGHHNDYSKRLDVEWLCVDCHKLEHGKLQEVSLVSQNV